MGAGNGTETRGVVDEDEGARGDDSVVDESPQLLCPPFQLGVNEDHLERGGGKILEVLGERAKEEIGPLGAHPGQVVKELLGRFDRPELGADLVAGSEPKGGRGTGADFQEVARLPSVDGGDDQVSVLVLDGPPVLSEKLVGSFFRDVSVEGVFWEWHCRRSLMRLWTWAGLRECRDSHP